MPRRKPARTTARPSARQRRFGRHQREPHDQRRDHAAGQRREIADQRGEDRQTRLFQHRQGNVA